MFTRLLQRFTGIGLSISLALLSSLATAQDMQLDLLADGALLIGVISSADGSPAAEISVQIALATQPATVITTLQTDAVGIFTYTGNYNTTYQVSSGNTSATVTTGIAPPEPFTWPPIYVTLGILMLLSLIPARLLRKKQSV